jgi:hypothetical protein
MMTSPEWKRVIILTKLVPSKETQSPSIWYSSKTFSQKASFALCRTLTLARPGYGLWEGVYEDNRIERLVDSLILMRRNWCHQHESWMQSRTIHKYSNWGYEDSFCNKMISRQPRSLVDQIVRTPPCWNRWKSKISFKLQSHLLTQEFVSFSILTNFSFKPFTIMI